MTHAPAPIKRVRGVALLSALAVVALVVVVSSGLAAQQASALQLLQGRQDQGQGRWLARAAVDWARNILAEDAATTREDHLGEPWAARIPAIPLPAEGDFPGGEISGAIDDLSGRFNLNNLAAEGTINPLQERALIRLMTSLGIEGPQRLANALGDWLDADDLPAAPDSAESAYYTTLTPSYRAANRPLDDVDDLLRVRGFTPAIVARLRPWVSALPVPRGQLATAINVNTAPPEVLSAVIDGLPLEAARRLASGRATNWFVMRGGDRLADFRARLPAGTRPIEGIPLDVRSQYFLVSGQIRQGRSTVALRALLQRSDALGAPWPTVIWQRLR